MKTLQLELPVHPEVEQLVRRTGLELFVVGGIVRDALFHHFHKVGFSPKDTDLATPAHPDDVVAALKKANITCLEIGKSFGVVAAVFPSGNVYEIATFREEWYDPEAGDGRRPDQVRFSTPEADAQRRDLTINALFYNLTDKTVYDYVGTGIEDVESICIRPVGDAAERYREDRLRVMRTVRFYCRYLLAPIRKGLDKETLKAIDAWKEMPGVSLERIKAEFCSGLEKSQQPYHYAESLWSLELFPAIFSGVPHGDAYIPFCTDRDPRIVLALLLKDEVTGDDLVDIKWDRDTADMVMFLKELKRIPAAFNVKPSVDEFDYYAWWKMREKFINKNVSLDEQFKQRESLADLVRRFNNINLATLRDERVLMKMLSYMPKASAKDFPNLQGRELGQAIKSAVNEEFQQQTKS